MSSASLLSSPLAALLAMTASLTAGALVFAGGPPSGPCPVAWDRAACSECTALVRDHAAAAQLQVVGGQVLEFDDPGCLFRFEASRAPRVQDTWFRLAHEDGWVRGDRVAFVTLDATTGGSGLRAVRAGTKGAISLEQARAAALSGAPAPDAPISAGGT